MGSELIKQSIVKKQLFIVNYILKAKLTMKRFKIHFYFYCQNAIKNQNSKFMCILTC